METELAVIEADNRKEFEDHLNGKLQFGFEPIPETFRAMIDTRYGGTVFCIILRKSNTP